MFILCCKYVAGLTQAGFYYLRGSWVGGLVSLVFVLNQDRIHIICLDTCVVMFLCCILCCLLLGGGSASLWWGGRSLSPVCTVSLAGLTAWGRFCNLGLGTGSLPGELCPGTPFR